MSTDGVPVPVGNHPPLELRPVKVRRVAIGAAVFVFAVFVVVALLLRNTPTGVFFTVGDQVAMVIMGAILAGAALLFARPRIRSDDGGLLVRNLFGTTVVPWDLVVRVSFPDGAPWARIELPDDEYLAVMAIQASDGRHAVAAIRELRAVVDRHAVRPIG